MIQCRINNEVKRMDNKILIELDPNFVRIELTFVPRPSRISASQWLDFWNNVDQLEELQNKIDELETRLGDLWDTYNE